MTTSTRTPADRAAERLVKLSLSAAADLPAEIRRGVSLTCALQAVISAHLCAGDNGADAGAGGLLEGLASTIGWTLSFRPAVEWGPAVEALVKLSLVAARGHCTFTGRGETRQ